jgi:hypothetical protein
MTDIVERLQGEATLLDTHTSSWVCHLPPLLTEAAEEIERLRADVARCEVSLLAWVEAVGECNKDRDRLRAALTNCLSFLRAIGEGDTFVAEAACIALGKDH